jgi:endonuclease/exonuclease/phosphatase family metal-dependent hydrolase
MQSATPAAVSRTRWAAGLVLTASLTVLLIYGFNRFVHEVYVTFSVPRQSLRVLTWNIGRIHLRWDSRASDRHLDYVAEVIRTVKPHIVALQEIRDPKQLGRLVTKLGSRWQARLSEDIYDRRAALLVRLKGRFYALPTSSGRTAQGAVLRLPGGREISVASLHLDAFDGKRRLEQAEEIIASVRRLGHLDIVLAGDFNCDAATATRGSVDQRLYGFLTGSFVDAAKEAGSTTLGAQLLDYVFYAIGSGRVYDAKVLRTKRVGSMDHYPVVVELGLVRPTAELVP